MPFCEGCGSSVSQDASFCPKCGRATVAARSAAVASGGQATREPAHKPFGKKAAVWTAVGIGLVLTIGVLRNLAYSLPKAQTLPSASSSLSSASSSNETCVVGFALVDNTTSIEFKGRGAQEACSAFVIDWKGKHPNSYAYIAKPGIPNTSLERSSTLLLAYQSPCSGSWYGHDATVRGFRFVVIDSTSTGSEDLCKLVQPGNTSTSK